MSSVCGSLTAQAKSPMSTLWLFVNVRLSGALDSIAPAPGLGGSAIGVIL